MIMERTETIERVGKNEELIARGVAIRNFPIATDKFAYLSIRNYDGAIMMKEDVEKLRDWCNKQLDIWDNPEEVPNLTKEENDYE